MQPESAAQSLTVPVVGGNVQHQFQGRHSQSTSQMSNQRLSIHSGLNPPHLPVQASESNALLQRSIQPQGDHVKGVSNSTGQDAQCQGMPYLSDANVEANRQLHFDPASIENNIFQPVPFKLEHHLHLHSSQALPISQTFPSGAVLSTMTGPGTRISWCPSLSSSSEIDANPAQSSRCHVESEVTPTFRVKNTFIDFEDSTHCPFTRGRSFSK